MDEIPEDAMPLDGFAPAEFYQSAATPPPPHIVNGSVLSAEDAVEEWLALNRWVDWLRNAFALPAAIVPPLWIAHELNWWSTRRESSARRLSPNRDAGRAAAGSPQACGSDC